MAVIVPEDLKEAGRWTVRDAAGGQEGAPAVFVGGATDLMPLWKYEVRTDETKVFLKDVKELRGITDEGEFLSIGAGMHLSEIAESSLIRKILPAAGEAAARTASPQIRNMGTLGGNLLQDRRCIYFNQSGLWRSTLTGCFKTGGHVCQQIPNSPVCRAIYYSDMATALLLYDAEAEYIEDGSMNRAPLSELIHRHCEANGLSSEHHLPVLLVRVIIPKPEGKEKSGFYKYAMRASIDFPLINFAMRCGAAGRKAKLIAGAVSTEPVDLTETAALLDDPSAADDTIEEACRKELGRKGKIIKEALFPPARKRDMYGLVSELLYLRAKSRG